MRTLMTLLFVNFIKRMNANKYCAFELDGEAKYYVCPRNEYCCNFGCCVNIAFQFYQLWYYWLLIIFMFLICSGGGWWYRFCRPNSTQYPNGSLSSNNSNTSAALLYGSGSGSTRNSPLHDRNRSRSSYQRRCDHQQQYQQYQQRHSMTPGGSHRTRRSSSYGRGRSCSLITRQNHRGRDDQTFYLQRIWKAPSNTIHSSTRNHPSPTDPLTGVLPPPPNYFATAASEDGGVITSSTTSNNNPNNFLPTSTMPTDLDLLNNYLQCPYYQLYGPPPSYDSIVQLSSDPTQCVLMCTTSLIDEHQRQHGIQHLPTSSSLTTVVPTTTTTTAAQQQPMTLLIGEHGQVLSTTTATATSPEHFCEMQSQNGGDDYEDPLMHPPSILVRKSDSSQDAEPKSGNIHLRESNQPPLAISGRKRSIRHSHETTEQQQPSTSSASTNTD